MSDAQFPARTAGDCPLPNGDTVWVCQLNTLLREEADVAARWVAQKETRALLKGGREYPEVVAALKALTPEQQAQYLAKREYFTIDTEVKDKYPLPEKPEQGDDSPEAFTKACLVWEDTCKKVAEKRQKATEARWNAEVKKNTALTAGVRLERCCTEFFAEKWGEAFVKQRECETMHRAVRLADDHTARYFASPDAYKDADDAVQGALRDFFYITLTEPKQSEIPPTPAA